MLTNKPLLTVVNLGEDMLGEDASLAKAVADELGSARKSWP